MKITRSLCPFLSRQLLLLGMLAITFLLFCAGRSFANPPLAPFVVPIKIFYGNIEVDGTLNGKPAHFILDSGATTTALDSAKARRFGLALKNKGEQVQGAGGDIRIQEAGKATVGVGKALLREEGIYALPFQEGLTGADGFLGFPFLQRFVVTIDYEHRCLGIGSDAPATIAAVNDFVWAEQRKRRTMVKPVKTEQPEPEVSLPLNMDDGNPSIEALVNGQRARLDIDSGDGGPLTLFAPYVDKKHLRNHFKHRLTTATGKGFGGVISNDVVRVATLTLGGGKRSAQILSLHGVVTYLSRQTRGAFATDGVSGQIGAKVLDRFVVTFDYPHARVLLKPNSHRNDPFVYNRKGYGIDEQHSKYVAVAVLPGGPAARAGVRDGDVIVSIDGVPIRSIMEREDTLYFHLPAGSIQRVVYQRGDQKPVTTKMTLREMLP